MSYRRSYSATITGVARDTVSYPASESGGTESVAIEWSEDVYIDIDVDTDLFDSSVHSLRQHVDLLTGSVIASESAHVREKRDSAGRVAESLNEGFNNLIRSEISQQATGLRSRVDSLLLKLNDLREACRHTQQTMQADYSRITERYAKVFEELDREVHRRVSSLDAAPIAARIEVQEQMERLSASRLCGTTTVTAGENAKVEMRLIAAGLRAQAHKLMQRATAYLTQEVRMKADIQSAISEASSPDTAAKVSLPVLYLDAESSHGPIRKAWASTTNFPPFRELNARVGELFRQQNLPWRPIDENARRQTERYLLARIDGIRSSEPQRDARIRENIMRLWAASRPQSLSA